MRYINSAFALREWDFDDVYGVVGEWKKTNYFKSGVVGLPIKGFGYNILGKFNLILVYMKISW